MTKTAWAAEEHMIDSKEFGLATAFVKPVNDTRWTVTFDTGVIMYIPDELFHTIIFHLPESDTPLHGE